MEHYWIEITLVSHLCAFLLLPSISSFWAGAFFSPTSLWLYTLWHGSLQSLQPLPSPHQVLPLAIQQPGAPNLCFLITPEPVLLLLLSCRRHCPFSFFCFDLMHSPRPSSADFTCEKCHWPHYDIRHKILPIISENMPFYHYGLFRREISFSASNVGCSCHP